MNDNKLRDHTSECLHEEDKRSISAHNLNDPESKMCICDHYIRFATPLQPKHLLKKYKTVSYFS